jgi:SAM-dependent methyltransferase
VSEWSEVPSQDWVDHTKSDDAKVVRGVLAPLMLQALDPKGKAVLDLGCGEGYFARVLKAVGATRVAGLDISPGFIKEALAQDPGGEYHVQDMASGPCFPPETFDAVGAFMSLMYIVDLDSAFRNIATVLRPSGRLVACITNPYYAEPVGLWGWALSDDLSRWFDPGRRSWKFIARQMAAVLRSQFEQVLYIRNYFESRIAGKKLTQADVMHVHRPFSDYLNFAEQNNLHLKAMLEPTVTPELLARYPNEPVARALANVPLLFVLVFDKA